VAAFQFYLLTGKQRKVGWVGMTVMFFGQKFPGEKESVRWCIVVMQQPFLLSPKFRAKSLHIFTQVQGKVFAHLHAVTLKRHSSMWN
jgi:hypothetical protein